MHSSLPLRCCVSYSLLSYWLCWYHYVRNDHTLTLATEMLENIHRCFSYTRAAALAYAEKKSYLSSETGDRCANRTSGSYSYWRQHHQYTHTGLEMLVVTQKRPDSTCGVTLAQACRTRFVEQWEQNMLCYWNRFWIVIRLTIVPPVNIHRSGDADNGATMI